MAKILDFIFGESKTVKELRQENELLRKEIDMLYDHLQKQILDIEKILDELK